MNGDNPWEFQNHGKAETGSMKNIELVTHGILRKVELLPFKTLQGRAKAIPALRHIYFYSDLSFPFSEGVDQSLSVLTQSCHASPHETLSIHTYMYHNKKPELKFPWFIYFNLN
jgi:hypothetical protein